MSGRRYKAGKNSYWQFLMSERKAKPHLSQEDLQVHVAKMWRRGGFDSYGRPLELLLTREAQEQAEMSLMQEEIKDWVEDAARSGKLPQSHFYIIQANVFCLTDEKGVVPAEIALARVSLANGVEEVYHELVHPGPLPLGYRADCIYNASKTHKIPLDMAVANQNYSSILSGINSFLGTTLNVQAPPVYILPKFLMQTQRVLTWLQEKANQVPKTLINLFSLPCLLFHLARVGKELPGCVYVPTENLAEVQLDRDVFLYTVGMACTWHQEQDETVHCSAALVRRWAFILCHICCPRHELELLPGRHKPSPKPSSSFSRGVSSGSTMSASSGRRGEGRRRKSAAPEMWTPNNWGLTDPDAPVLSTNEEEKTGDDGDEEERESFCPLAAHPFLSLASTTADPVAPSRDSILVIPPLCFSDREEVPSIVTSINDDHLSLATTDTIEEQDLLQVVDDDAEDHVSVATSMSESNMELPMSLVSSKVEEEEEDWVWEGLSQWSLDLTTH